jgi:hypothetical protein
MFPVDEFARKSIAAASALLSSTVVVRLLGWAGKGREVVWIHSVCSQEIALGIAQTPPRLEIVA